MEKVKPVVVKDESKKFKLGSFLKTKKGKVISIGLGVIILGGGLFTYDYLAFRQNPNVITTLGETLEKRKDNTCLDEILMDGQFQEIAAAMVGLEESLAIKTKLEELELDKYNKGLKQIDIENLSNADVLIMIEQFKKASKDVDFDVANDASQNLEKLVATLTSYRDSLASTSYTEAVATVNTYVELLAVSQYIDSIDRTNFSVQGFSTNLLELDSKEFKIYYKSDLGKIYECEVTQFSSLYQLVKDVRKLNSLVVTPNMKAEKFQEMYVDIINRIKVVSQFTYEVEGQKMTQEGTILTKKIK